MIDNIFGHLTDADLRLATHREMLGGVRHFHRTLPSDPLPGQPLSFFLTTSGPQPFDAANLLYTLDDSDPADGEPGRLELTPEDVEWDEVDWRYVRRWRGTLPAQPAGTMIRYHLAAHVAGTGHWIFADNQAESATQATDFAVYVDNDPSPAWARDALVYQIFVDRFNPGAGRPWNKPTQLDGFFGGTLKGVIEKLDYIQSLGFNAIWLSPFFTTTSHHGYNASDYYTVEPRYGTNQELKELINEAHARGMHMVLDFVANHWSKDHPTFRDAQANPDSPYRDWYIWNHWPDDYECYFNVRELPKLNLLPGDARAEMLRVAQHWLREGFDGYRLDFAFGPPHDFWADFRRACHAVKPEAWIFGEIIHTAAVQRSFIGRMDGTLDFLLTRALRETFGFGRMSLNEFEAFLSGHESYFPSQDEFSRPSFLDNHDMSRFYYIAGESKGLLEIAALVMYALSGSPIVYNGTEAGVSQERPMQQGNRYVFEEARLPMNWDDQDGELLAYFRRLGTLRTAFPVLREGRRTLLHVDSNRRTYAFAREDDTAGVIIALNLSDSAQALSLPIGRFAAEALDRLNGHPVVVHPDSVKVTLPGRGCSFIA